MARYTVTTYAASLYHLEAIAKYGVKLNVYSCRCCAVACLTWAIAKPNNSATSSIVIPRAIIRGLKTWTSSKLWVALSRF
jgi:hypothetical protein